MLRNNYEFKWNNEARSSFENNKQDLTQDPILISQYYSKDFLTFYFASEDTIVSILLQRNDEGYEQPISLSRKSLRDAELKYCIIEKQAYALVKALKSFRIYSL